MSVRRWSPFDDLLDIQRDIGRFFRKAVGFGTEATTAGFEGAWVPAIDVYAKDGALMVEAELPGVSPADIEVKVRDGALSITGERREEKEVKKENIYHREQSYGRFKRSVSIPKEVEPEDIKASYANGVLTVEVPGAAKEKREEGKEVKVEVKE